MTTQPLQRLEFETFTTWIRRLSYVLFACLFAFEFLNLIGILEYRVEYTWRGRAFSTAFVFAVVYILDRIFQGYVRTRLPGQVWFVAAILMLMDFLGDIFSFYGRWTWYDQVAHFMGGPILVTAFYIVFDALAKVRGWKQPRAITLYLAYGTSVIFAVLYEVQEYLEDFIYRTNRLGDGPDTANDMMLNLIGGAVTVAFICAFRYWRGRRANPSI